MITANISIIIPVWNSVYYIACCLDSILNQSYQSIEVIIIDDASTDGTNEILQHYAVMDNRIVLSTNPHNIGPGASRNIGIQKAKGEYILFVDSDDFLTEGTLATLAQHFHTINNILIFNGSAFQHEDKFIINTRYIPLETQYFSNGQIKEEYLLYLYESHTPCMKLYTVQFLHQHNIRFPESVYGEDVEFWIRCLTATSRISYLPYFGYMRRYRTNSIMTAGSDKNIIDRFNNISTLLELTKFTPPLYQYISNIYLQGLCRKAIAQNRKLYQSLFPRLFCLSEQFQFGISQKLVSVVIPVYNQSERLVETLNSVVNQTHIHLEVFVIDDGSEDNIVQIIQDLDDKRIKYHRLPHQNANVSRNHGIQMAQGKYIAMLDADDLWKIDHLENCIKTLEGSGADGLYGDLIIHYESGKETKVCASAPQEDEAMINYLLRTGYGAQTSTLFMTARSVKDIMWDETLNRHQDYDFVVRYSQKYQFTVKNNPTVIYLCSPQKKRIDFDSCIRFINLWKKDIAPEIYHAYNKSMLQFAIKWEASPEIIKYYREEATCYIEYISLIQYLLTYASQDEIILQNLKDKYIQYITDIEIKP